MRLSYLAQDRLDLAETAKHLAQRMSEPREFDFVPLKRAARLFGGKAQSSAEISKTETASDKNDRVVLAGTDLAVQLST